MQLSVVIPVFNEYGNVLPLVKEISKVLADRLRYEIVIVDDASSDTTRDEIAEAAIRFDGVRPVVHKQNRGQSAAIRTGVNAASAPVIAVLDGDGQNDPADIPALFARLTLHDEISMVVGERKQRRDSYLRKLSSQVANKVRAGCLKDGIRDTGCGMKVFYRDNFLALPCFDHMHRFLPALIQNAGGTVCAVPVNHRPRTLGKSKYGVGNRLWVGIFDILGVMWLQRRKLSE